MRFIYFMLAALCLLIVFSYQAHAAHRITYFYDGDTVKIQEASKTYKLRLNHIDAPERNQSFGKKSRRALMKLCQNAAIQVNITGTDKYSRRLGGLYCNQQDASSYMLKNGYAWFYLHYSNKSDLAALEASARKKKLGLWQTENPTPPWVWRHRSQQKVSAF
jgi:endonuclease YncB( thermonuclease family)